MSLWLGSPPGGWLSTRLSRFDRHGAVRSFCRATTRLPIRCWTDGNRSAYWREGRLEWVSDGEVVPFEDFGEPSPSYGPVDALAVHPTEDVVWLGAYGCHTWRVDVRSREQTCIEQPLANICYVGEAELWAVTGRPEQSQTSGPAHGDSCVSGMSI